MRSVATMALCLQLAACGYDFPTPAGTPAANTSYFPLAVGNRWVYVEKDNLRVVPDMNDTKEITGTEELDGEMTYVMVSTPEGRPGSEPITKRFNWLETEGRVDRVRAEDYSKGVLIEEHSYAPGFPRFIDSLQKVGDKFVQTVTHDCSPVNGITCSGAKTTQYTWSVEAVDAVHTVPAGTFTCIKVRRQAAFGNYKEFWYARGVGKIYEWGPGNHEELLDYTIEP
jgi:hypothetical protein